jgi:hypothetical protein
MVARASRPPSSTIWGCCGGPHGHPAVDHPDLLAVAAIVSAIRAARRLIAREPQPLRCACGPSCAAGSYASWWGSPLFELGNIAATLLILRATELVEHDRGHDRAVQVALLLYALYNLAATLASVSAGRLADRRGAVLVLTGGSPAS